MPRRIESIHGEHEYGTTTPVVPRIDSPPRMPSRGFQVCRASSSPSSTDDLDDDVAGAAVPRGDRGDVLARSTAAAPG